MHLLITWFADNIPVPASTSRADCRFVPSQATELKRDLLPSRTCVCMCRGGAWFVATQAMGWALFSISLVCLCWLLLQVVAGVAYCIRCWALITGSVMFCAQLVSPLPHIHSQTCHTIITHVSSTSSISYAVAAKGEYAITQLWILHEAQHVLPKLQTVPVLSWQSVTAYGA